MADSVEFSWTENETFVCYEEQGKSWCGRKDECQGMALPLFLEITWPWQLRAVLYLIGLLYSFFGISIVSDLFMGAIEKITSSTKKITLSSAGDDGPEEVIEVPIWNGTVANLTLMALGKSFIVLINSLFKKDPIYLDLEPLFTLF